MNLFNLQAMGQGNDNDSDSSDDEGESSNERNESSSNNNDEDNSSTDNKQLKLNNESKDNINNNHTANIANANQMVSYSTGIEALLSNKDSLSLLLKSLFKKILESSEPEQTFLSLLEKCRTSNQPFSDEWFPPNENSLIKGFHSDYPITSELQVHWRDIKWLRQSSFLKYDTVFFSDIEPSDIKAGELSNPNFVSVIAVMSENQDRIKKLFITDEFNEYGLFGVNICRDGELKEIVVDDYFPVNQSLSLCFSSDNQSSLWVQILEKCYAKAYGSYNLVQSKEVEGILRDLTYAPTLTLDNSNDNLTRELIEAYENNWLILASAGETEASQELLKEIHLRPEYDYAILQVYIIQMKDSNGTLTNLPFNDDNYRTLLKIRNLWSQIEWIGDWSEISTFWNDKLKEKMNYYPNDNCFYMNLKDFKHYFSKIKICKYMPQYQYKSIRVIQKPEEFSLIHLTVDKESNEANFFISFVQQDNKNFKTNEYTYGISRLILCKIEEGQRVEYIEGKMGQEREIFLEKPLQKGEYLIFAELTKISIDTSYVISVYSNEENAMKQIPNDTYPSILERIFISCAKIQNHVNRFEQEGAPQCYKYFNSTIEGYTYIYFENNEKDATLIEDVKYTKFEGLKLLKPFSGTSFRVEVGPGQSQIILIKHLELNEYNLIFSYQSSIQFGRETLIKLAKSNGVKKKRKDNKEGIDIDINVFIYKHTFGLCYYYENNTKNKRLRETLNIANNTNVDFVGEKEGTNEVLICVEPSCRFFVELRGKNNLWKVQPLISYVIENIDEPATD